MSHMIYGASVRGASHIRSGVVCQDSYKQMQIADDVILIAVADGHGSSACPYSKTGSKIATNVFCSIMEDAYHSFAEDMNFFMTYLNREGELKIAQSIDVEWKRRVWKAHLDNKREKPIDENGEVDKKAVYKQYGTTLLGLMITPSFVFAFQLGDGDILFVDNKEVHQIVSTDKILGTETHSLSKIDAWKKVTTIIRKRDSVDDLPYLYLISTDGFSNSHKTERDFHITCKEYFKLIGECGFNAVASNLKNWLNETSEHGCGDDITVVMVYFESPEVLKND